MKRRSLARLGATLACTGLAACAGSPLSSKTEDEARALVPVPICLQRLPKAPTPGSIVSLGPAEYWSLLLPNFDARSSLLDPAMPDCSGRQTLAGLGAGGSPAPVQPDSALIAAGPDGFKIVWLPLGGSGPQKQGLLALLRQRAELVEVYALGTHTGTARDTRFTVERMGPRLVVTAHEEHCRGEEEERRCDAHCTVYLLRHGQLAARATFPMGHTVDVTRSGSPARYRFSASADYREDSILVSERLSVLEKGRGEVRATDLQRVLRLEKDQLVPSTESLWVQAERELGLSPKP